MNGLHRLLKVGTCLWNGVIPYTSTDNVTAARHLLAAQLQCRPLARIRQES